MVIIDLISYFKRGLNKKGVSGIVISIILVLIGLAIVVTLLIMMGNAGTEKIHNTTTLLTNLQRGDVI